MGRIVAIVVLTVVPAVVAVLGAEAFFRWSEGYRVLAWRLEKPQAGYGIYPGEIRYLYNRLFRDIPEDELGDGGPGVFDPRDRFGTETAFPRYMFKPNYRLALEDGVFRPVGSDFPDPIWESNARGFRGESFPWSSPQDDETLRVIAIGGSVTEGQVSLEGTYPYQLERRLAEALPGRAAEVLNAGFAGLGPPDMLALVQHELLAYEPDVVVYFDAGNGLDPFATFEIEPVPDGLRKWLFARSALYRGLLRRFERPVPGGGYTVLRDADNPKLDTYIAQLDALAGLVEGAGADFLLLGPVVGYGEQAWTRERVPIDVYWLHEWWNPVSAADVLEHHYRVSAEAMADFAAERGIPFLDLQEEVGADPENFYRFGPVLDLGHFSAQGNARIAEAVAERIAAGL